MTKFSLALLFIFFCSLSHAQTCSSDLGLSTSTCTIPASGITVNSGSIDVASGWAITGNSQAINGVVNIGSALGSSVYIQSANAGGGIEFVGSTLSQGFVNYGTISGFMTGGSDNAKGVYFSNSALINGFTNYGLIQNDWLGSIYIENSSVSGGINNNGTVRGGVYEIYLRNHAYVDSINNSGTLTNSIYTPIEIDSTSRAGVINNLSTGVISGFHAGIESSGTLNTINNQGSISAAGGNYVYGIENGGQIGIINNTGSIVASGVISNYGIYNLAGGSIGMLNNLQGGNAASASTRALTYSGDLPSNYNIIIRSPNHYGQLYTDGTSSTATTFGVYAGGISGIASSNLNKGTYTNVLTGVAASKLTGSTTGNYSGFTWALSEADVSNGTWNLIVTGAYTADTQQSLVNTANALAPIYTLQNSVLANSFAYDCNVFGENDVCVSAGGRNTAVSAANELNNTSALLIAGYRLSPHYRIGAYADQNLSVNNAGSAVSLGNNTPLLGLFGAWNERLDGTGAELKVSAAYGQKNATVTRQAVGTSEAGTGSSQLNSQGAQVLAKYGFGLTNNLIVSPYVGMRYTQNNMGGYTEGYSSAVTAPLTYAALNTNATTALAGVSASFRFIPPAAIFASAGVETDTNTNNGTYSATGIVGLTPISFNASPVKTRATAALGAYYEVAKNQRLGIAGIYRQEPFQAVSTTSVMMTYSVGL